MTDDKAANLRPPWKPGQSGNPAGRRGLAGVPTVAKVRERIARDLPQIIERLTAAALSGDVAAARTLLERVVPPCKPIELPAPVELPAGASPAEQGRAILGAVADGTLAPGQGAALVTALGTLVKIIEASELQQRVEALEARS